MKPSIYYWKEIVRLSKVYWFVPKLIGTNKSRKMTSKMDDGIDCRPLTFYFGFYVLSYTKRLI